ncbi:unnamed protein product [Acanthosepion pharaonis]|uniref:Uncharacterized protein n=1 Tax=Acanthosepion pharaonis TaxID=158019 RepID=A0A812EEA7_ACAPH|nr:unnamed protein product [Sepia pharaonis]
MNTDRYLQMPEYDVWPTVPGRDNIGDVIFMQDDAPPHFALTVRYTKEEVYKTKPRTLEDLETRIQEVLNDIPDDVLQKILHSILDRLRYGNKSRRYISSAGHHEYGPLSSNARKLLVPEYYVWPTVPGRDNIGDQIFMQDGAPHNFALTVRAGLNQHFPERWTEPRGPHKCPPRSSDLNSFPFFLWGYTKEEVYKTKPRTLEDLETRIQEVLNDIPDDAFQKVLLSILDRFMSLVLP